MGPLILVPCLAHRRALPPFPLPPGPLGIGRLLCRGRSSAKSLGTRRQGDKACRPMQARQGVCGM